jgi:hypothetical protein
MDYTCNCSPNQSQPSGAASSFGYNSMPLVGSSDMASSCGGQSPEAGCSKTESACHDCCTSVCLKTCTNNSEPYDYGSCSSNCVDLCRDHQGPQSSSGMTGEDAINQCMANNTYVKGKCHPSDILTCALPKCGPENAESSGACRYDVQAWAENYCTDDGVGPYKPSPDKPSPDRPSPDRPSPDRPPITPAPVPNRTSPEKTPSPSEISGAPFLETTKGKASVGVGVILGIAVIVGAVYFMTKPKGRKK